MLGTGVVLACVGWGLTIAAVLTPGDQFLALSVPGIVLAAIGAGLAFLAD